MSKHFGELRSLLANPDKIAWARICRYVTRDKAIFKGSEGELLLQYLRDSLKDRKHSKIADVSWLNSGTPALFLVPSIRIDSDHAGWCERNKVFKTFAQYMETLGIPLNLTDLYLKYPSNIHYSVCDSILGSSNFKFERLFVSMGENKRSVYLPPTVKDAVVKSNRRNFTVHLQNTVSRLTYGIERESTYPYLSTPRTLSFSHGSHEVSQLCLADESPIVVNDIFLRKLSVHRLWGNNFDGVEVEALKIRHCQTEDLSALLDFNTTSMHTLELGGLTKDSQRAVLNHLEKYHHPRLSRVYLKGKGLASPTMLILTPESA